MQCKFSEDSSPCNGTATYHVVITCDHEENLHKGPFGGDYCTEHAQAVVEDALEMGDSVSAT